MKETTELEEATELEETKKETTKLEVEGEAILILKAFDDGHAVLSKDIT